MSPETTHDLVARLAARLGPGGLLTEESDIAPFAIDWRRLFPGRPACVARPASTAEVADVVRICREAGAALVPQGGNTGLAGGAVPDASGTQVVLSLMRMNAIRAVDPVGLTLTAEAGCVLKAAQDAAADVNRLLPVSFAAEGSAMVGGVIATNAGGLNVVRYGMTRGNVLGLEVVLGDGTVVDGLRALCKDNAGYDWKQLFIGSEGTLGIVTAAVLRLTARPRHVATALLAVPDPQAALRLFTLAQDELGDAIQAFELISGLSLDLVARHGGLRNPLGPAGWYLLVEAASSLPSLREAAEGVLATALEQGDAVDGVLAESSQQAAGLWALREGITEAEAKEGRGVKHDVSVPITAIPAFLEAAGRALAADLPGARANAFGHMGDGNIHYNVLAAPGQTSEAINQLVHGVVEDFGGSISAEHGIGQYRVTELVRHRRPGEIALARRIKAALDPDGLLNPGKVLAR
ncbi:FAD-binding oxidoreductase [Methylobacterium nodulans]|uniref:FAD linked oxidase domain protein n=1 Tax=Methylobacterium nodulans (strain LMG 21967 / CNCM I-2342 / ORS 2060) TaxID=460265 RepID=B8IK13_METNO|nr:FAD-binding oxidoreductase [Methylobacterium nodulans]ACL60026.1 FAD linked oxidase domain protein [Methylobacterium nodulans ORS 2060]